MSKTVLFVTYHFPPSAASGSFRLLGFAQNLPNFGWQPVVVAPPTIPWEPVDAGLAERIPAGTQVCTVPYPRSLISKPFRRLAPYAVWLGPALRMLRVAIRKYRPEAVFTSGPPHCVHLLGLWCKWRYRLPWVADFRDPWVANGKESAGKRLSARREAFFERWVMRKADAIVANAPLACSVIETVYPVYSDKMVTITNGFDEPRPEVADVPRAERDVVKILHAGELYYGRDPRPFLDALSDIEGDRPGWLRGVSVHFLGTVTAKAFDRGFDFEREVRNRGLEQIVIARGWTPYQQVLQEMRDSDILLMLDTPGRRIGIPAKAYEYLGVGRPLLALSEKGGDVEWLLRESGAVHRIAPPRDSEQIKRAMVELVDVVRSGAAAKPNRAALRQFTREHLARKLADLLDRCTSEPMASLGGAARENSPPSVALQR